MWSNPCSGTVTGRQSGMQAGIMSGLSTHLVQELNACTVGRNGQNKCFFPSNGI